MEEREQASETGMVRMLELLDQEFKITMINTAWALMDKVESV